MNVNERQWPKQTNRTLVSACANASCMSADISDASSANNDGAEPISVRADRCWWTAHARVNVSSEGPVNASYGSARLRSEVLAARLVKSRTNRSLFSQSSANQRQQQTAAQLQATNTQKHFPTHNKHCFVECEHAHDAPPKRSVRSVGEARTISLANAIHASWSSRCGVRTASICN